MIALMSMNAQVSVPETRVITRFVVDGALTPAALGEFCRRQPPRSRLREKFAPAAYRDKHPV
jgi:hypothetical protein